MDDPKPKFNPNKPFTEVKEVKPSFDPNKPFEDAEKKSQVGGSLSFAGGQVGNGKAPLDERKVLTDVITQKPFKKIENPFAQTKEEAVTAATNKLNDIMYKEGEDWKDPLKASLTGLQKSTTPKEKAEHLGVNTLIEQSLMPDGFQAKEVLNNTIWGQLGSDNLTSTALRNKAAKYEQSVAPLKEIPVDEDLTNASEEKKDVYSDLLGNAAIKKYAQDNPQFRKELVATGIDINDPDLFNRLPSGKRGMIMNEVLQDKDWQTYIQKENPQLAPIFEHTANNILTKNKDFGINQVANKVSQAVQKTGYNSIDPVFNFHGKGHEEMNDLVAQQVLTPQELQIWNDNIKNNQAQYMDEPSLFESIAGGIKSTAQGYAKTFTEPFTPISKTIEKKWEQEASNVSANPSGLMEDVRNIGHNIGMFVTIAATGNVTGLGGVANTVLAFGGDQLQQWKGKYPNNPIKAWTGATINTALYGMLAKDIFPIGKAKQAFKSVEPEVSKVTENLASGKITREVARIELNTLANKAINFGGGTIAKTGKVSLELGGLTEFNRHLDRIMGMDEQEFKKYHPDDEVAKTLSSTFVGFAPIMALAKFGEMKRGNKIVEQSLYQAANNPKYFERIINDLEVKDPTIDKNDLLNNLKFLFDTKQTLDAKGIEPKNQPRYLWEAMRDKVASQTKPTEASLSKQHSEEVKTAQEVKERILAGEDADTIIPEAEQKKIDEQEETKIELERLKKDNELDNKKVDAKIEGIDGRESEENRIKLQELKEEKKRINEDYQREVEKLSPKVKPEETFPEGQTVPDEKITEKIPEQQPQAISSKEDVPQVINEKAPILGDKLIQKGLPELNVTPSSEIESIQESRTFKPSVIDPSIRSFNIENYDVFKIKNKEFNKKHDEKARQLAKEIKNSKRIEATVGYINEKGELLFLEGQHRLRALQLLGYKEAPIQIYYHENLKPQPQAISSGEQVGDLGGKEKVVTSGGEGKTENIPTEEIKGAENRPQAIGEKVSEKRELKLHERLNKVVSETEITDPYDTVLKHFAEGGKIHTSVLQELFGNKRGKSVENERRARISLLDKNGQTIDQLAHSLWERDKTEKYTTEDYKDAIERVLNDYNSSSAMAKDLVERYDVEAGYEKYMKEKYGEEAIDITERMSEDEMNHLIQLESDATKEKELQDYFDEIHEQPKTKEPPITDVNKEVGEAEKGTAEPPPKKPTEPVGEGKEEPLKNKALANRLVESKNIPKEAKKGIEDKGLKYEPQSHEEAATIAKEVIEQEGLDNAVLQAQAGKFGGDVNTLIQTEALDRLAELSDKEPEGAKKFEYDKKFAEIATGLDEWLRNQAGRGISALNYFYKKSPLGIVMMENAKRGEDFKQWSKPKEKSWREFFDELKKEPEFEKLVKEEVKKERAEERKTRTEKVHQAIDETLSRWAKKLSIKNKGDIEKQGIGDIDKIMKAVGAAMKKAYDAGETIKKIVQDAIDYISEQLGTAEWNSEDFRAEWEKKLQDKKVKKSPTEEDLRAKILERYRKKLRGLPDKQKDEVIRRSFKELIENGALEFDDFKKIIGEVTGRGELTPEQIAKMKDLVKTINEVEDAGKKVQEKRTKESLIQFHTAQLKAGKATRELNELFNNKPDIVKRLTSIMQLNTLGIPSLINNPIYNVFNQMVVRLPVGLVNDIVDRTMAAGAKLLGKPYEREWNILETQKDFFKGLGLGTKEAGEQFLTGLNRQDYIQKEVYGQQIRPFRAWRDLIKNFRGNMPMSTRQWWDKALQGTFGIPAEVVARTLNLGDKPQRFAAEKAQASAFSKILGLKNIDKAIFMEFPREEAYRAYKAKGLSDVEAGKKADYIKESIIKEGQRSTFQQDNLLNDVLTRAFGVFGGKESGTATLLKSLTISPYIKIPSNAFWSFYNLVNPEVALLQSMIHGARALSLKGKEGIGSEKALREARYWMGHAITGIAIRAVVVQMVNNGIFTPSQEDETKKEREGRAFFEPQGTVNVTKLAAFLRGERPQDVEGGVTVSSRWFGILGMTGNTIARKYEDMTPEQREKQQEFWNVALGGMEVEALRELQNGVFSNTSAIINSLGSGSLGAKQYGLNVMNMVMNIAHPAVLAQISRAQLPYYTTTKAESFLKSAENSMLARSSVLRSLTGKYPEPKLNIWGEPMLRQGSVIEKLFGINHINKDNFAQPIYEDVKQTGDIGFFPPSVPDRLGDKKLNNEQQKRLTELVGQARKNLVAPYINDMAEIEGFGLKYSELKDLDIKKKVLQYLYDLGKEEGVRNFVNDYPEFQKEGLDLANEINNARLEVFREINKVKTLK